MVNAALPPGLLRAAFAAALPYERYLATAKPDHREKWRTIESHVALTPGQRTLVGSFTRRVNVVVLSGTWCGDCAAQCPMLAAVDSASPAAPEGAYEGDAPGDLLVRVRFLDRDTHMDLAERVPICDGLRVPTAIFCAEDFHFVSLLGDKTLSRLRASAARKLGAACPLPGARIGDDELAAALQDWVNEFERVHLLLRLSPRLRERHGD